MGPSPKIYQSCQGILVSQSESRRSGGQYGDSEDFTSIKMTKFVFKRVLLFCDTKYKHALKHVSTR
jgi:hypothetical protein